MQPLTTKELNYINDMLGTEELLLRTAAGATQQSAQTDIQQFLRHVIGEHQRRFTELTHLLEQHETVAH